MARKKAANGDGSICVEKATGLYRAAFTDPQGKRIVKRFKERTDASAWLTEARNDIFKDTYIPQSDITVGEWVVEYLQTYSAPKVRPKTLLTYMQTASKLEPIADVPLQSLTAHAVQKYYNSLPDMSSSCKLKIHKLLKAIFTKAYNLEMLKKNIMLGVEAPRLEKKEIEIFTQDEIQKIIEFVANSEYYNRYLPMMMLAITTGARLGEILGLKRNCIHNGYIVINNSLQYIKGSPQDMPPKTQAGIRRITISHKMENALRRLNYGNVLPFDSYVFHTTVGTPFIPRNIERVWKSILLGANVPHKKFHCLRHTHATQLLANGIPLLEVAKRLGHSTPTHTLKLYGHAIPDFDKTIPDKVDEIFAIK